MTNTVTKFSQHIGEILRNADRSIRSLRAGDHRRLYNLWRVTMGTIATVDSFYVAFFRDDDGVLVFPYIYDGREYQPPGFQMYGPSGLAMWIRSHVKPYTYRTDGGRLLNMGHSFGDTDKLSRDVIAIPLLE